eukprot:s1998_g6.t1
MKPRLRESFRAALHTSKLAPSARLVFAQAVVCARHGFVLPTRRDAYPRALRRPSYGARVSGAMSLSPSQRSDLVAHGHSFAGERITLDLLDLARIGPPPGLSRERGASDEPWSASDEGHECFLCHCCHNGRMKPHMKQRAAVKSISEAQLLELLLAQLSMRAHEAGRFDTLFPVLQAVHCRLSVSSRGQSDISGAALRNMEKMMSKMSCQQMVFFADKNPNVDNGIMQLVKDQVSGSRPAAPLDFPGLYTSARRGVHGDEHVVHKADASQFSAQLRRSRLACSIVGAHQASGRRMGPRQTTFYRQCWHRPDHEHRAISGLGLFDGSSRKHVSSEEPATRNEEFPFEDVAHA